MSIWQGNITVQSKKEAGEATQANNGLTLTGNLAQLGGGLIQNTYIGLNSGFEFAFQGSSGDNVLLLDEVNGIYFFGFDTAGDRDLVTGWSFDNTNQIEGRAAGKVGLRIVESINGFEAYLGDVNNDGNGTKIFIDDNNQSVEITNVPAGAIADNFATFDGDQIKKIPAPVESGTYTPTISNLVNLTDATPNPWQYMRVGNVVTVSGAIDATINAAANTVTEFTFDLPINSDLPNSGELAGTLWNNETAKQGGLISDDGANTGFAQWYSQSTNGALIYLHFTYLITVTPP